MLLKDKDKIELVVVMWEDISVAKANYIVACVEQSDLLFPILQYVQGYMQALQGGFFFILSKYYRKSMFM